MKEVAQNISYASDKQDLHALTISVDRSRAQSGQVIAVLYGGPSSTLSCSQGGLNSLATAILSFENERDFTYTRGNLPLVLAHGNSHLNFAVCCAPALTSVIAVVCLTFRDHAVFPARMHVGEPCDLYPAGQIVCSIFQ